MRLLRQELFFRAKNHVNKLRKYAIYLNQTVDYIEYCSKDEEKREQEVRSLNRVGDSFKKVVVKDNIIPPARGKWYIVYRYGAVPAGGNSYGYVNLMAMIRLIGGKKAA